VGTHRHIPHHADGHHCPRFFDRADVFRWGGGDNCSAYPREAWSLDLPLHQNELSHTGPRGNIDAHARCASLVSR
jgi:hypothetical protein